MKIEKININKLIPYENNPRNNEVAVAYVMKSIEKFGYLNPIIVNKDYVVICGHTRLKAIKELNNASEIDVIVVDDLDEEEENMFRLVDNKVSEYASWDYDKVLEESKELMDDYLKDFDFEQYDISNSKIDENDYILDELVEKKVIVCPYCGEEVK